MGRRVFKLAPYGQPGGGRTPSQPNLKRRCTQGWSALPPPNSVRVRTFGRLCGTKLTLRPIQIQQNFNGPHSRRRRSGSKIYAVYNFAPPLATGRAGHPLSLNALILNSMMPLGPSISTINTRVVAGKKGFSKGEGGPKDHSFKYSH